MFTLADFGEGEKRVELSGDFLFGVRESREGARKMLHGRVLARLRRVKDISRHCGGAF